MCYPKILKRIELGAAVFARSPMSVFKEHAADLTPSNDCKWPWRLTTRFPDGLEFRGIRPDTKGIFEVNEGNITQYMNIMVDAHT